MKASVSTETLVLENKEVTLVSVTGGDGGFGICDTSSDRKNGLKETFFVGQEAIINIAQRNPNNPYSNKLICQHSSIEKCTEFQRRIANAVTELYLNNKPIPFALGEIFTVLKNGLYAVYYADMIPTDGAGNFFWNAYLMNHEYNGSSKYSTVCKKQRNVNPAFLVSTETIANISEATLFEETEKIKNFAGYGGIAFHLSGMFCALLSNHHTATAALLSDKKFRCVVIEPLRNVFFKSEIITPEGEEPPMELCDYIYSPYVKIPVYKVPQSMLEVFFTQRSSDKTKYYEIIRNNSTRTSHLKSKRTLINGVAEKCERQPDTEMLQSAAFVDKITDEELEALLNGEIMLNDKIIINSNYYSSVCIACNFLQYVNFNKFLEFSMNIMRNENLTAMHQFVANRLMTVMDVQVKTLFEEIKSSNNSAYQPILSFADKYLKRYERYMAKMEDERKKRDEKGADIPVFKRNTEVEINALEMAKKLQNVSKPSKK